MARYSFTVGTETGSVRTLESDGESPEAARQSLQAKGYFVFAEARARPWRQLAGRSRAGARINARTLLVFNQELLALVKAGLPILTALDLLRERGQHPRLRSLLDSVRDEVRAGVALSVAMGRHPRVFPPLYTAALHAGEQSGNFVDALGRYVEYQKRMLQLRQRLRAALTYPVLLCVASASVVTFLLTYVVPVFSKIYGDMDSELPAATRILLLVTARFREWLPVVVLLAVAAGFLAWRWWRIPEGRRQVDRWLLQVPVIGPVLSGYLFSRFARTLAMLQAGGIPMIPSLETTLEVVGNAHLLRELRTIIPRVAAGSTLADSLGRSGVVPALLVELIAVGETSGSLGDMLGHGADMYDAEMDTRLTALAAIIEPIIMVGMGLVVAAIVVVMYLPIFHLSAVVK
ncbi:MAG TPA: type II secretion system F family protein [Candidatus Baltobacteraceae bacterium]|nr:type II secretion system F family protein [Candidatus Baltobacteraceae bacterium]